MDSPGSEQESINTTHHETCKNDCLYMHLNKYRSWGTDLA